MSWRSALIVAVVMLLAGNAWLNEIFGYGEIPTDIPVPAVQPDNCHVQ
ncbi:hypothetical protein [Sphingomonas sp.]